MQVTLEASGLCPLIVHNERLADPLDDFTIAIAAVSKKRNKTIADHETIARLEFFGSLYTKPSLILDADGEVVADGGEEGVNGRAAIGMPAWNVVRCLQDGATRNKRGKDVLRGVHPIGDFAELKYDGPASPAELFLDGSFSIRKSVGIQRARTMRTRAMFVDWALQLPIEVDMTVFDLTTLEVAWKDAGTYAGLAEMRPIYGRFTGTITAADTNGRKAA
jgi:hypothetical protein